ncbi:cell division protein FtsQ/DivIB [Maritalea porphyrae]|uniref:cell division protein FtsQ/DivIB n=1 Tax=Maritalea porphyrae TaxID=880732 RepID=UPI0022AFE136|nr:cell division protein FtsQ/DivIB [Maritalea porphyrae]MCZ4272579.1 cell division protein FtsQ/DivIB [Maritalea porphyrae]
MQQVKPEHSSQSIAVAKPLGADLVVRRATHLFVAQSRNLWVLHKQLAVRLIALVLVVSIGAAGIAYRGHIGNYLIDVSGRVSALFAQAGLSVAELSLSGYALTNEDLLFGAVGLESSRSLVSFDAEAARLRLEALPSIESATIRKVYPNSLIVDLVEKQPVAIWTVDGVNFAIDGNGDKISPVDMPIEGLPLFVGDGAADDVPEMIALLAQFPDLNEGLLASSRIGDRRWDLIYDVGLRVMLPETKVAKAMEKLMQLQSQDQVFERDIAVLDLRLNDYIAVRPVDRTPAEGAEVEPE